MDFIEVTVGEWHVEDWSAEVSEGYASLSSIDVTPMDIEIGDILVESDFLEWCEGQGMTINKDNDGNITIATNWKENEQGGIYPADD